MPRRSDRSRLLDRLVAAGAARVRPDRLRSPVVRRALRQRITAWAAAAAVALAVWSTVSDAHEARRRWEPLTEVLVASRTIEPGEQLVAADLRRITWPLAHVPDGAIETAPIGERVIATIVAGEVLVDRRFAGSGSAATRLRSGRAAVSLPLGTDPPPIAIGDRVDVVAPRHLDDWADGASAARVVVVASGAEILEVGEGHATVSVAHDEVAPTTAAILDGVLTVVLRP